MRGHPLGLCHQEAKSVYHKQLGDMRWKARNTTLIQCSVGWAQKKVPPSVQPHTTSYHGWTNASAVAAIPTSTVPLRCSRTRTCRAVQRYRPDARTATSQGIARAPPQPRTGDGRRNLESRFVLSVRGS